MTVNNELIDRLLADYKKPEDQIGENGLLKQLTKRLVDVMAASSLRSCPSTKPVGRASMTRFSRCMPEA